MKLVLYNAKNGCCITDYNVSNKEIADLVARTIEPYVKDSDIRLCLETEEVDAIKEANAASRHMLMYIARFKDTINKPTKPDKDKCPFDRNKKPTCEDCDKPCIEKEGSHYHGSTECKIVR